MQIRLDKLLVAAVQMEPEWMNKELTTEKVCQKINELGKQGIKLIVFPEVIIPGTTHWNWIEPSNNDLFVTLFQNSVEIPSGTVTKIASACKASETFVIIGIHERVDKALYNTILFIDENGELIGQHRKLIGTHSEKIIWASGDGTGLTVYNTKLGKIGGLICAEHNMSLARHALALQGEEIHAAVWISGSARRGQQFNDWIDIWTRSYAMANQTFVISSQSVASEQEIKRFNLLGPGGGSAIIAPDGTYIKESIGSNEQDVIAEIDLSYAMRTYTTLDTIRYHGRPDVFNFSVNKK